MGDERRGQKEEMREMEDCFRRELTKGGEGEFRFLFSSAPLLPPPRILFYSSPFSYH